MNNQSASTQTWAACLTGHAASALATLSLRGPDAIAIADRLFRGKRPLAESPPGVPLYGHFGQQVEDDVVLVVLSQSPPHVEVHCHGGTAMIEALLAEMATCGATIITAKEMAAQCGLTPIQVLAADALAKATSRKVAAILLDQYQGALDRLLASESAGELRAALAWSELGLHLIQPWNVVLLGEPNVGKSSLLNALVGFERAIVADVAGTTRDVLHEEVLIDGWPVRLLDGAGFRDSAGKLEAEGQRLYEQRLRQADLKILVVDLSQQRLSSEAELARRFEPDLVVGNKSDLAGDATDDTAAPLEIDLRCSATRGEGIGQLRTWIVNRLVPATPAIGSPVPFTPELVAAIKHRLTLSP